MTRKYNTRHYRNKSRYPKKGKRPEMLSIDELQRIQRCKENSKHNIRVCVHGDTWESTEGISGD